MDDDQTTGVPPVSDEEELKEPKPDDLASEEGEPVDETLDVDPELLDGTIEE